VIEQVTRKDKFSYTDEGIIIEFNSTDMTMILKQSGQIYSFKKE
jgi:hypothetical protein